MRKLTFRSFVVFAQFDNFVDVLSSKGFLNDNDIALEILAKENR